MTEFAQQDCRKLCDKIYQVFPREIRDIVYDHIHSKREICLVARVYSFWGEDSSDCITYVQSKSEYHLRTGSTKPVEDHLWRKEYMGEKVMRELVEYYFRSVCFRFEDGWDFVQKFRVTDQWNLGWVPGEFVTNIQVSVDCSAHVYETWPAVQEDRWAHNGWNANPFGGGDTSERRLDPVEPRCPKSELLVVLESLFSFRRGTKVTLNLRCSRFDRESPSPEGIFEAMTPIIFPTLRRLCDSGIVVNMVCSQNCDYHPTLAIAMTDEHHHLDIYQKTFRQVSTSQHLHACRANDKNFSPQRHTTSKSRKKGIDWRSSGGWMRLWHRLLLKKERPRTRRKGCSTLSS